MIPIPAKLKLVLGIILVAAIGALQALSKLEPAWSWAGGVVQLLTMLELYFTVPHTQAVPDKVAQQGFARVGLLAMLSLLALIGCALFGKVAPPAVAAVGCIVDDAAKGDSIAQIVLDCGGDVAQVIGVLTSPSAPAAVSGTKAQLEAQKARAALAGAPQ